MGRVTERATRRIVEDPDTDWQPLHERLPKHDPDAFECECIKCYVHVVRRNMEERVIRLKIQAIEHDLDDNCTCDTCEQVRQIRDQY